MYVEIGPVIESYERQVEAFVVLTCNTSVLKPFSLEHRMDGIQVNSAFA